MYSHDWTPAIALVGLLLAIIQWVTSLSKAKRERDSDLTGWGSDVIDLMAELETQCTGRQRAIVLSKRKEQPARRGHQNQDFR